MGNGIRLDKFTVFPYKGIDYLITTMFFTDSKYLPPKNSNISDANFEKCFDKRQKIEIEGDKIRFLPLASDAIKMVEDYLDKKDKFMSEQVKAKLIKPVLKSHFKFDELQIFYTEDKKNVYLIGAYCMDTFESVVKENCKQFSDFEYYINIEEKLIYLTGLNKNGVNFFLSAFSLIQITNIEEFKQNLDELEFLKTAEYIVSK